MTYHHFCKSHKVQKREKTSKSSNRASCKPVTLSCVGGKRRQRKQRGGKRDRWLEVVRWQRDFTKRSWRQQVWKVSCIMLFKSRPTPTLGSAIRELTRTHARRKDIKCVQSKHPNSKNKAFTFSEENSGCLPMQNSSSWFLG